ncbi:MAG: hypothetical protein V4503_00660 [Gemmatimonadota bacterium]
MRPDTSTRLFAVLGNPVAHSLSPRFQNAAFRAAGLDAVYLALAVARDDVAPVIRTLCANGGGGNVTLPYKEVAGGIPARASARVRLLGAANLFGATPNGLELGNTDVDGILAAFDALGSPAGPWYVLGTGGSARAVAGAALERGVPIAVRSRDAARAAAFGTWASTAGLELTNAEQCRVVINATPLGLAPDDAFPIEPACLTGIDAALDLTYRLDGLTPWVRACQERGIAALDGREVLLHQGAASWALWFPGILPPLDVMRAAIDGRRS